MFAVIFEVQPKAERWDEDPSYAKQLRPELERIDGFADNNRYASKRRDGWLLSLSTWRDEKAVIRWRTHALHHQIQEKGRFEVFRDYHLRVGEIRSDTHLPQGQTLREQHFEETEVGAARLVTITEATLDPAERKAGEVTTRLGAPGEHAAGLVAYDVFESINTPGAFALVCSWRDAVDAAAWLGGANRSARHRAVRIVRDYGMADRREAPQFYPPVKAAE